MIADVGRVHRVHVPPLLQLKWRNRSVTSFVGAAQLFQTRLLESVAILVQIMLDYLAGKSPSHDSSTTTSLIFHNLAPVPNDEILKSATTFRGTRKSFTIF